MTLAERVIERINNDRAARGIRSLSAEKVMLVRKVLDIADSLRPATPADILAVLAPQAAWKLVMQEDDEGCAVACLAMVTGQQYADVLETLPQPGLTHGLSDAFVMHWLHERGFYTRRTWGNTPRRGLLLTRPSHWVVCDGSRILDPARGIVEMDECEVRQVIELLPHNIAVFAPPGGS
jgi:hypothetical protein